MSVYFDEDKKRWRFSFNRKIARRRIRATKLLPQGWSADRRDQFDRVESARLYAEAKGLEQPEPLISEAVRLYVDHKVPELDNGQKCARDLALLHPYYKGKTFAELGAIALDYRKDQGGLLAPATIKNRLSYLRAACRYAWKYHKLGDRSKVPGADMAMPTVKNERQVYVKADGASSLETLLSKFPKEDRETAALVTLEFYTGMRWVSEILKLGKNNVVRDGGLVWLVANDRKNDVPHMVPVHPAALWAVDYIPFEWSASYYYDRFWKARAAAGMDHVRKHDMRHSLASALISKGATLREVQEMLGQESAQSTERYAHLYRQRLAEVMQRVGGHKSAHRQAHQRQGQNRKSAAK